MQRNPTTFSDLLPVSDLPVSQSSILFSQQQHQVMRCRSTSATTQAAALQTRDHSRSWIRYSPNITGSEENGHEGSESWFDLLSSIRMTRLATFIWALLCLDAVKRLTGLIIYFTVVRIRTLRGSILFLCNRSRCNTPWLEGRREVSDICWVHWLSCSPSTNSSRLNIRDSYLGMCVSPHTSHNKHSGASILLNSHPGGPSPCPCLDSSMGNMLTRQREHHGIGSLPASAGNNNSRNPLGLDFP